jgi:hypothetical protein
MTRKEIKQAIALSIEQAGEVLPTTLADTYNKTAAYITSILDELVTERRAVKGTAYQSFGAKIQTHHRYHKPGYSPEASGRPCRMTKDLYDEAWGSGKIAGG